MLFIDPTAQQKKKLASSGNGRFPIFPGSFLKQGWSFPFTIDLFQSGQVARGPLQTPPGPEKICIGIYVPGQETKIPQVVGREPKEKKKKKKRFSLLIRL